MDLALLRRDGGFHGFVSVRLVLLLADYGAGCAENADGRRNARGREDARLGLAHALFTRVSD